MGSGITRPCIVILAAGSSSRLGRPKQVLSYGGETMVEHAVSVAIDSGIGPVLVVTGSSEDAVAAALKDYSVSLTYNPAWDEGIGTSIRHGVEMVMEHFPETDGLLMMVCDQPYVTSSHLQHLLETQHETGKKVVASSYAAVQGTPVLFHASFAEELKGLAGDQGARLILSRHEEDVAAVAFPDGIIDIDTETDYENLLTTKHKEHP